MATRVTIYALCDPRDQRVRYVGQTATPDQRLKGHLSDRSNEGKRAWVDELRTLGLKPDLKPLVEVSEAIAEQEEQRWIRRYLEEGASLFNAAKRSQGYSVPGRRSINVPLDEEQTRWLKELVDHFDMKPSDVMRQGLWELAYRMELTDEVDLPEGEGFPRKVQDTEELQCEVLRLRRVLANLRDLAADGAKP